MCGRLAAFVEAPAVAVRLKQPPPLEKPLAVRRSDGGATLLDGEEPVAEARPAELAIEPPQSPSYAEAEAASGAFSGFDEHIFPSCFVCGPEREPGDGLRIFPGPWQGRVAAPWTPDASLAADADLVAPEFLWSALDCPGGFSFPTPSTGLLLGELTVSLRGRARVGERCVLVGWEIAHEGRKHRTGTALFGASGACLGLGLGTWLEPRPRGG